MTGDIGNLIPSDLKAKFVCKGRKVHQSVERTANGGKERYRIVKSSLGHDVRGSDSSADKIDDARAGLASAEPPLAC